MSTIAKRLAENVGIQSTELFAPHYDSFLKQHLGSYRFEQITELAEAILNNFQLTLTNFQKHKIGLLFKAFDEICKNIDPHRLAEFSYAEGVDDEFVFYRKNSKGLSNLIIHDEDCVSFSYIPFDSSVKSILLHFESDDLTEVSYLLFKY